MSDAHPYTVIYALERMHSTEPLRDNKTPHACYHHIAYVVAPHADEAIDRCRQDALPGFVFRAIVALYGHADFHRRALGDGVVVHDFREPEGDAR